jgi:hypothetical protein
MAEQEMTRDELARELERMTQAWAEKARALGEIEDFLRPAVTFTHLARMEGREPGIAYAAIGRELVERFAAIKPAQPEVSHVG